MKIGIIGEDPYDTNAIKNLLSQKYSFQFIPLLKQVRGDQLSSAKTRRLFKIELKHQNYPIIIFTKDLDGLETESRKKKRVQDWFNQLDSLTGSSGILLLNIYELEALILADIEAFNKLFRTKIKFKGNPMFKEEPKEFLMSQTRKSKRRYSVSENPAIFKSLRIQEVIKNCPYFRKFITAFDKMTEL